MNNYEQILNQRRRINKKYSKGFKKVITGVSLLGLGLLMPNIFASGNIKIIDLLNSLSTQYLGGVLTPVVTLATLGVGTLTSTLGIAQVNKNKNLLNKIEDEERIAFRTLENEKEKLNLEKDRLLSENDILKNNNRMIQGNNYRKTNNRAIEYQTINQEEKENVKVKNLQNTKKI